MGAVFSVNIEPVAVAAAVSTLVNNESEKLATLRKEIEEKIQPLDDKEEWEELEKLVMLKIDADVACSSSNYFGSGYRDKACRQAKIDYSYQFLRSHKRMTQNVLWRAYLDSCGNFEKGLTDLQKMAEEIKNKAQK